MPSPKIPFSVRLPKSEKAALVKEAKSRDLDTADVLRELVRDGRRFRLLSHAVPKSQWDAMLALIA